MSRSFDATGNQFATPVASSLLAVTGSVTFWFNPGWNSGDGIDHQVVDCEQAGDFFRFQKYLDDNCYIGWDFGGVDDRVIFADTGLFVSGTWAHWAVTWTSGGTTTVYKDGVSKGTHVTPTSPSIASQTYFGARPTLTGANGLIADIALWNSAISSGSVVSLAGGARPNTITPSPFTWAPFDGVASPEPDNIDSNPFTLSGSPPAGGSSPPYSGPVAAPPFVGSPFVDYIRTAEEIISY
jgi:hypothetical protein